MIKVAGKNGIYAELVQHSCDDKMASNEVLTVSVKYGLIVHSEFLRHRQLSRGVKSNRAIPMATIRKEVLSDPYVPVWFGARQNGMVADKEVRFPVLAEQLWRKSRYLMCGVHYLAEKMGAHKEWANRLLNPWQWVRETITATEWDNLYNLRIHPAAQKDIKAVVDCIYELHRQSNPMLLRQGEWHVPYVERQVVDGCLTYVDNNGKELTAEQAIKASAARCARSSYDKHDGSKTTYENDLPLYNMLVEDNPKHASPVEHQATPMKPSEEYIDEAIGNDIEVNLAETSTWENGATHLDKQGNLWSGNFKGFVQHRQLLENHTCNKYEKQ